MSMESPECTEIHREVIKYIQYAYKVNWYYQESAGYSKSQIILESIQHQIIACVIPSRLAKL